MLYANVHMGLSLALNITTPCLENNALNLAMVLFGSSGYGFDLLVGLFSYHH